MRAPLVSPILAVLLLVGCKDPPPPTETAKQPATPPASQPASAPAKSAAMGNDPSTRDHADPDGVVRRGDALSEAPELSVSEVITRADALAGKTVKVTGAVESVCKKKGCWFVLEEGDHTIRITSKGYKFFVPVKAAGMSATIEGELSVKTIDQETAQHYEDEKVMGTGQPPAKVDGPKKEIAIAAVGLEMRGG